MTRLVDIDALDRAMYHKSFEVDDGRNVWNSGLWIRYKIYEEASREHQLLKRFLSDTGSGLQKARVESISIAVLNAVISSGALQTITARIAVQGWMQRGKKNELLQDNVWIRRFEYTIH